VNVCWHTLTSAGGFGSIREAAQIFVVNELEPTQSCMTQLNDWLGEEVVKFKSYEIAVDENHPPRAVI